MGALVEITGISMADPLPEGLAGGNLDVPAVGRHLDATAIDVVGWALGSGEQAVAVEFGADGETLWRTSIGEQRPDLEEYFPELEGAASGGFRTSFSLLGRSDVTTLDLEVVLADRRRLPLARIDVAHGWRRNPAHGFADLISVVICSSAGARGLNEAIESVLGQSHPHVEVVVIEDGSAPDEVRAVVTRHDGVSSAREPTAGVAAARNLGIRLTSGDFLLFLDAGDRLLPDALEANLAELRKRPEAAFASGWYRGAGESGEPGGAPGYPAPAGELFEELLRSSWLGIPATTLYRRAVFEHARGFDPDLGGAEDYDLGLRIASRFPAISHGTVIAARAADVVAADPARTLAGGLAAIRRCRPARRRDRGRAAARRTGRRRWRRRYGEALVERHRRERVRGDFATLLRHYKRGALKLLVPRRSGAG